MKKRWMSLILTVIMMLSLAGCGRNANLSSVSRDPADSDGTVWFDEEAVALAGSVQRAGMSEAEIARANELRTMATDALALVNAKRAENGLAELTWSNGLESWRYGKSTGSCFQILSYQTERQRLVYREQ